MKAKIILVIEPETGRLKRAQIKKAETAEEEKAALEYLQLYMDPINRFRKDLKKTHLFNIIFGDHHSGT